MEFETPQSVNTSILDPEIDWISDIDIPYPWRAKSRDYVQIVSLTAAQLTKATSLGTFTFRSNQWLDLKSVALSLTCDVVDRNNVASFPMRNINAGAYMTPNTLAVTAPMVAANNNQVPIDTRDSTLNWAVESGFNLIENIRISVNGKTIETHSFPAILTTVKALTMASNEWLANMSQMAGFVLDKNVYSPDLAGEVSTTDSVVTGSAFEARVADFVSYLQTTNVHYCVPDRRPYSEWAKFHIEHQQNIASPFYSAEAAITEKMLAGQYSVPSGLLDSIDGTPKAFLGVANSVRAFKTHSYVIPLHALSGFFDTVKCLPPDNDIVIQIQFADPSAYSTIFGAFTYNGIAVVAPGENISVDTTSLNTESADNTRRIGYGPFSLANIHLPTTSAVAKSCCAMKCGPGLLTNRSQAHPNTLYQLKVNSGFIQYNALNPTAMSMNALAGLSEKRFRWRTLFEAGDASIPANSSSFTCRATNSLGRPKFVYVVFTADNVRTNTFFSKNTFYRANVSQINCSVSGHQLVYNQLEDDSRLYEMYENFLYAHKRNLNEREMTQAIPYSLFKTIYTVYTFDVDALTTSRAFEQPGITFYQIDISVIFGTTDTSNPNYPTTGFTGRGSGRPLHMHVIFDEEREASIRDVNGVYKLNM